MTSQLTKANKILKDVKLPSRFKFSTLVEKTQKHLSKEVFFLPWHFPPNITGACLQSETAIYIFYAEGGSTAYQTLIKLHELVHVLSGHMDSIGADEERSIVESIQNAQSLYDNALSSGILRKISNFKNPLIEKETEEIALLFMQRLLPERTTDEESLESIDLD